MQPDKAQLDTIESYLRLMASKEKALEILEEVKRADNNKAQELVKLFEQRSNLKPADVQRILKSKGD
jgi:hypothetical protein